VGVRSFQPMNINFGLFPPIEVVRLPGKRTSSAEKGFARKRSITARALADLEAWLAPPAVGRIGAA